MSWIQGSVTGHVALSNAIVAAATGNSVATVGISSGGSSYVVGDILSVAGGTGTVTAQIEVTSVAAGVIDGVRVFNAGVYTVNPSTPNSVTGGSGTGASLTLTFGSNGWTANLDQVFTGTDREVCLEGSGGGSDEIFIGWRTFSDVGQDIYSMELHGFTGYNGSVGFLEQPGISPGNHLTATDGAYMTLTTSTIQYWLSITPYRIVIIARVGSNYWNGYLGWGNRFATSSEYPYPILCMGSAARPTQKTSDSAPSSGLIDPWRISGAITGPAFIMSTDNSWYDIVNRTGTSPQDNRCIVPTQQPDGVTASSEQDKFTSNIGSFADIIWSVSSGSTGTPSATLQPTGSLSSRMLLPSMVVFSNPSVQVLVELDDIYWFTTFGGIVSEDRIYIDDEPYRVFMNGNRSESFGHFAIKEQ